VISGAILINWTKSKGVFSANLATRDSNDDSCCTTTVSVLQPLRSCGSPSSLSTFAALDSPGQIVSSSIANGFLACERVRTTWEALLTPHSAHGDGLSTVSIGFCFRKGEIWVFYAQSRTQKLDLRNSPHQICPRFKFCDRRLKVQALLCQAFVPAPFFYETSPDFGIEMDPRSF
jgi:hypothetical protein